MNILLIRHFKTLGNQSGRYIGVTDEDILCEEEFETQVARLRTKIEAYGHIEAVYSSPLRRCVQTGQALFPKEKIKIKEGFKECDFGEFENKNYLELSQNTAYQAWVDSGGTNAFPGGEDPVSFRQRCVQTFVNVVGECEKAHFINVAMVVHGGTIMSILEGFANEGNSFYDYQIKNGEGYALSVEPVTKEKETQEIRTVSLAGQLYWISSVKKW